MKRNRIKVGIIGGTGMDDPRILKKFSRKAVATSYGRPASELTLGKIGRTEVVILARQGFGHTIPPGKVPYRANIFALKQEGCTHIIVTTACGSLREEIRPGDFVFPDQFIDFTRKRETTFFDEEVVHTPMSDPFDKDLRKRLIRGAQKLGIRYHPRGTVLTVDGPRFSSRAESEMFRLLKIDVLNMTTIPEVTLANELKIPYQAIAMVTDYDCWRQGEEPVTFPMIVKRMETNARKVKKLLVEVISSF
jgi:5'-methylthioadenosine phosphorylase